MMAIRRTHESHDVFELRRLAGIRTYELNRAVEEAVLRNEPTSELRAEYADALAEEQSLRAEVDAELDARAKAGRLAEEERFKPGLAEAEAHVHSLLLERIARGFSIEPPPLPRIDVEAAKRDIDARAARALAEQALEAAHAKWAAIEDRRVALQGEHDALIARRSNGEMSPDDAAALALNAADTQTIAALQQTALSEYRSVEQTANQARAVAKRAAELWSDAVRMSRGTFYGQLAERVETLLAECLIEHRREQLGCRSYPQLQNPIVRACAKGSIPSSFLEEAA
jgi:hypothetical protein